MRVKKKTPKFVASLLLVALLMPGVACASAEGADNSESLIDEPSEVQESVVEQAQEKEEVEQANEIVFEDVSQDDEYYRFVVHAIRFGLIQGISEDSFIFEPNRIVTRAEFITMLGRLHEYGNEPIGVLGEGLFYERYLNWAVELGILRGDENGDLMLHSVLNREQKAVIVYRYIEGFDLWYHFRYGPPVVGVSFRDKDSSLWAGNSVELLRSSSLVFGYMRYFYPQTEVSRGEALEILVRLGSAFYDGVHPFPMQ